MGPPPLPGGIQWHPAPNCQAGAPLTAEAELSWMMLQWYRIDGAAVHATSMRPNPLFVRIPSFLIPQKKSSSFGRIRDERISPHIFSLDSLATKTTPVACSLHARTTPDLQKENGLPQDLSSITSQTGTEICEKIASLEKAADGW